jgi:hypothetical protein
MINFTGPASVPCDSLVPFTDQLRLAFTSTGVVYGVADPAVTGLPVLGVSA